MITRRALLLLGAALAGAAGDAPAGQPPGQARRLKAYRGLKVHAAPAEVQFGHAELVIVSATGRHPFHVEVARTPAQMERGLMFRRHLAPDAGMLFEYPAPTVARFWMHNTLIRLDMLFVDGQGRIVNIARRASPLSDAIISSAGPVLAVIELPGGTAARLGITPGDRVIGAFFGDARQGAGRNALR